MSRERTAKGRRKNQDQEGVERIWENRMKKDQKRPFSSQNSGSILISGISKINIAETRFHSYNQNIRSCSQGRLPKVTLKQLSRGTLKEY